MFAGPSGTGKTTLCNVIRDELGIDFISGSISDLIPETKGISHSDMLARDPQTLALEDWQLLNLRNKLFRDKSTFVTDRSYLDSAAYFIYKQAKILPACEVEGFLSRCLMAFSQQCTHLILIPFNKAMFKEWITEDNNKRITSKYFQMMISQIMNMVLNIWDFEILRTDDTLTSGFFKHRRLNQGFQMGQINNSYGKVNVLILNEINLENRIDIIKTWLNQKS